MCGVNIALNFYNLGFSLRFETACLSKSKSSIGVHMSKIKSLSIFMFLMWFSASSAYSSPEQPLQENAIDPNDLVYTPEVIETDGSDLVYLYDLESLSIFRYSTNKASYIETLSLVEPPTWVTYSLEQRRLYLGYASGKITYFDTTAGSPSEIHFTSLAYPVEGLLALENLLFAADTEYHTFDINGTLLDSSGWQISSAQYAWNTFNGRLYHRRDAASRDDIEWIEIDAETGLFGGEDDSPYLGKVVSVRFPFRVSVDGQLLLNGAGQLLDAISLGVWKSLSNYIDDATWVGDQLVTVAVSSSTVQFWDSNYELDFQFFDSASSRSRVFNHDDQLLVVSQTSQGPVFLLHDLSSIQDSDADGVHDLKDNCPNQSNSSQLDYDADLVGDICDEDDDNDNISDAVETQFGLNPKDPVDAMLDMDFDGFSNLLESVYSSDMDDVTSVPNPITILDEGFEEGWPQGFLLTDGALPWVLMKPGEQSSTGLYSAYVSDATQKSSFSFAGNFTSGVLGFSYLHDLSLFASSKLEIVVDGVVTETLSGTSFDEWGDASITLLEGEHHIEFRVVEEYPLGLQYDSHFVIDDFYFSADSDGDSVADIRDNCPDVSNRWQHDSDQDGIGNDCDNDPYGQDEDGDGYGDGLDNCPAVFNPDQENLDSDNEGDACDSDLDGDGLSNDIEDLYVSLDKYNPDDAVLDSDNDGASNEYEVSVGNSPDDYDHYEIIELQDFFPWFEFHKLFSDSYDNLYVHGKLTEEENVFIQIDSYGFTRTYERREDGIYLVKAEIEGNTIVSHFDNYLILPDRMIPGVPVEFVYSITMMKDSKVLDHYVLPESMSLIGVSETQWKDVLYPSITFEFINGHQTTYLKGIGEIEAAGKMLEEFEIVETQESSSNSGSSNGSKSGGSGGNTDTVLIFFLMLLMLARSRKTQRS